MPIEIGYDLPFTLRVSISPDDLLRIRVRARAPGEDDLMRIWAHVEVFVHAALFGMGVSADVLPRIAPLPIDPEQNIFGAPGSPTADSISFEARGVVLEADYIVVLLHKLYALDMIVPLAEVVIDVPRAVEDIRKVRVVRSPVSRLPDRYARLPFRLDDAELAHVSDHVCVSIAFSRPLEQAEIALLWEGFMVWNAQALQGGYMSPRPRDGYFLQVAERLRVIDEQVEWELDEFEIDLDSLNALVNLLVAFHALVPIHEVALG
jgi:hypothetical protein